MMLTKEFIDGAWFGVILIGVVSIIVFSRVKTLTDEEFDRESQNGEMRK